MSYRKVITYSAWRRPKYTLESLQALSRCRGIEGYKLLAFLDYPTDHAVVRHCAEVNWADVEIHTTRSHLHCNGNIRRALRRGFEVSDYVIHVEDDIVLSPDAIQLFEWYRQFGADKRLYNVSTWRHPDGWLPGRGKFPANQNLQGKVKEAPGMYIWGWATWRDRWEEMEAHWSTKDDQTLSWDTALTRYRHDTGRVCLCPLIGRAINIGKELGTHREADIPPYWAGSPGFKKATYFQRI